MEATALTAYDNNGGCGVPSVCSPSSVSSPVAKTHGDGLHGDLFDGSHRRSSTSSSDTAENGAPVMPISHHPDINTSDSSSQSPSVSDAKMQTQSPPPPQIPRLDFEKLKKESSSASSTSDTHSHQMALPLPLSPALSSTSPSSAVYNTFSFEEVMSPRHQNGKRYLGGYLQHRVSMAGGFLKSWKRKYFRLRDHGIVCYKNREDSSPLFEILFKAHSMVLLGKLNSEGGSSSSTTNSKTVDRHDPGANEGSGGSTSSSSKGKVTGSLVFILKHVEIVSHQTPAGKVEVPLYLKAESGNDYTNWIECLRLKIDARKRAVAHSTVQAVVSGSSNSRTDSYSEQRSTAVGSERGGAGTGLTTDAESESAVARKKSGADEAQSPTKGKPVRAADSQQQQQKDNTKNALYDPSTSTDPPEFAQFQSKYLLMKEIGEGSFSIVHKAVNRLTGRLCAVKCCKYSTALEEEVSIMRKLSHPNIVGVEGVYHQDNMYFVVMDLMENGDLCDRLIQRQKLPECEVQVIISQVLQGLEYLHRHNILHRDIKPENILLHGDAVKIADFGLAKQLPNAASMLKRSCGTLEYAAPELLVGQPYGLKSDIFSLGVVLYVLLFGAFPFSIESAAALQCMERFPEGIDVRDMSCLSRENIQWRSVSQQAQDVILKMLAPKEKDRVSAKDLLVHPWFDPERTSSTASLGAVLPNLHRDSNTWKVLEMNAAGQECVRLADCEVKGFKELLGRGLEMTKYGNKGSTAPHATTLSIDFPQQVLSWTARPGPLAMGSVRKATVDGSPGKRADSRSIRLCDIQEVRLGHATDAFKHAVAKGKDPPPPELCISIVCSWRTLDLVVKAPSQREFLSKGLLRLINGGSRKV
ncbi:Camk/camk2 protein kinase [Globisporangium polare]